MAPLERLQAIEDIRILKARYFRYMDSKHWDALAALFTQDMKILTPSGAVYTDSGPAYAASLKYSLEHSVSVHQGFMSEIEIIDEANATGVWAMQDVIEWTDRHPTQGWKSILGRGHYHDTYRNVAGSWLISGFTLTRLRLDVIDAPKSLF
jgi:hypothetical protein